MKVSNISIIAIAGGLWANVFVSSSTEHALATQEGNSDDRFSIAGAQGADGNPVVWRLEKSTGKVQLCHMALGLPKQATEQARRPIEGKADDKNPFGDLPQLAPIGGAKRPATNAATFDDLPQGAPEPHQTSPTWSNPYAHAFDDAPAVAPPLHVECWG